MNTNDYRELFEDYYEDGGHREVNQVLAGRMKTAIGNDNIDSIQDVMDRIIDIMDDAPEQRDLMVKELDLLDAVQDVPSEYRYFVKEERAKIGKSNTKMSVGIHRIGKKTWAICTQASHAGAGMVVTSRRALYFTHDKEEKIQKLTEGMSEKERPIERE